MLDVLDRTRRLLWGCVELGFVSILAVMLIYLVLGQDSGVFVLSVADNVIKFANAVPTQSLVGMAILLAIIFVIMQRLTGA
jgi:hypothetical protein